MEIFNVCTCREYEKDGEKKTQWLRCGVLKKTAKGKMFIDLNMFPNTTFFVFEQKKKDGESWDE